MGVFDFVQDRPASDGYQAHERHWPGPEIEPGQIWLVECASASLYAVHATLMSRANVVLYERTLAAAVAEVLPIGVYAEPLPETAALGPAVAPRALQFAADGWSVVQLVEQPADWRRFLRSAAGEPNHLKAGAPPLLAIGTIAAGRYRQHRAIPHATGAELAAIAAGLGSDALLSLTFAPLGASPSPRTPAPGRVFTANGLAG